MEQVLFALVAVIVGLFTATLLFAFKIISMLNNQRIDHSPTLPHSTESIVQAEAGQYETDQIHPTEDGTVPLEQFTPDFNRPLKIVTMTNEFGDSIVEEQEDDQEEKVKHYVN